MTKLWISSLIGTALLLGPAVAASQEAESLVTDRPDFTESASVPGGGRVQVEGGWTVEEDGDTRTHSVGEILVRMGIGDRFEARVEPLTWTSVDGEGADIGGGDAVDDADGLDDVGIGFKAMLFDARPPGVPAVAFLLGTTIPTGDEEIGEEGWQPEARLALGWDLSDLWSLGANAGWGRPEEDGERFDQALGSIALGRSLGERVGAFLELYGLAPAGAEGDDDAAYLDGGLTLAFGPDAQLDARAGAGLTDAAADWFFGLGFARRW
ncbi:MAG TPA: transporter [Gemmatimonadota bacterium]|nr:transporter [Gemmatimonadota bacterium]